MTQEITLAALLVHTKLDDTCLVWTGHASLGKYPQMRVGGKVQPVRRMIWSLVHETMPHGLQVGVSCDTDLCVHPDCLVARKRSKIQKGKSILPDVRIKIALARRAGSKLTLDKVRAIRTSGEPSKVIEAAYGLKPGYASRIRAGLVWADSSSHWAGLGARV